MEKSTEIELCPIKRLKGGYKVQPVPTPPPDKEEKTSMVKEGGKNQNLILFNRGKDISGLKLNNGTNQFPKPPIIIGITKKKIMTKACAVTTLLKIWSFPINAPGILSSNRIK